MTALFADIWLLLCSVMVARSDETRHTARGFRVSTD
jgi:hypothetical protein